MISLSKNINRKIFLNITAILTVISLFVYVFAFSLPHDFHCAEKTDFSVCSSLINNSEATSQTDSAKDSEENNHQKDGHSPDNCPVCNLSYFNGLYYTEPLICRTVLIETNEKPVNNIKTDFSSFTFLKFFLRSPPSFKA